MGSAHSILAALAVPPSQLPAMSSEEVTVEAPAAAEPEEQQPADGEESKPKLAPGERVKRPVRPDDTEIKAAVDVLQQSSECHRVPPTCVQRGCAEQ